MHSQAYLLTVRSAFSAIARTIFHRSGRKSDRFCVFDFLCFVACIRAQNVSICISAYYCYGFFVAPRTSYRVPYSISWHTGDVDTRSASCGLAAST